MRNQFRVCSMLCSKCTSATEQQKADGMCLLSHETADKKIAPLPGEQPRAACL